MLVVFFCLCFILYIFWEKVVKVPKDAPPRLSYYESMKIVLQNDVWSMFLYICELSRETRETVDLGFGTLGLHKVYAISNPEDSLTVLKSCAEKGFVYDLWKPWLGEVALFTGPASVNKVHRKFFLPLIVPKKLDSYVTNFDEHAKKFVTKMAARAGQPPFDILRDLLIYNIELFCSTLFGLTEDMYKDYDFNPYCNAVSSYMKISMDRFRNILFHNETIFKWSSIKKKQDKELEILHKTAADIIERRLPMYLKQLQELKDGEPFPNDVYIDVLMEAVKKGAMSEKDMKGEIDSGLFGGHDTTAFTVLYAIVMLGSYPEVQEKVVQELEEVLGKAKDVDVKKEDLSKMVYLEACIKESMRLYPYAAVVARRLDKDVKLRTCTLKEGSDALVLTWQVHRHVSWGPDVDQYRPERWLEPDKLPRPTAMLGFSEGPRACAGKKYAMLSMKTLLAHFVRSYRIQADHKKMQFELNGILEPKSGHEIRIEHRM